MELRIIRIEVNAQAEGRHDPGNIRKRIRKLFSSSFQALFLEWLQLFSLFFGMFSKCTALSQSLYTELFISFVDSAFMRCQYNGLRTVVHNEVSPVLLLRPTVCLWRINYNRHKQLPESVSHFVLINLYY